MAIFHFSAKVITRSDGGNAVAAAAYRAGTRLTCERTGQTFNYTRKSEVTHRVICAPSNSPSWAFTRGELWNQVEFAETRVNSQLAREVEVSLPIELTHAQHVALLNDYVQEQFVSQGMVADIALHAKSGNPHAHILITLRDITADGFGAKRRDWNDKVLVTHWRQSWATACNAALEQAGCSERIDHRSNKARGIDAPATVHLGRRTPLNSEAWDARADFNAWVQTSVELAKVQAEVKRVQSQIIDLTSTISQALAERDAKQVNGKPAGSTNASRIWTPGRNTPRRDFSIAGILGRRMAGVPAAQHTTTSPQTQPTPSSESSHVSSDFSKGGESC